jgi:hypothetical protein
MTGLTAYERWMVRSNLGAMRATGTTAAQQAAILRANGYFRVAAAVEATARDERDDILDAIANTERDDA